MPRPEYSTPEPLAVSPADASASLDHLLQGKSRLLRTKLEVLAAELCTRLAIWDRNLARIGNEKGNVEALLEQCTRLARYHLRDQKDVGRLRDSAAQLETQRREQDVQCWRDVVLVMRDFLDVWEVHEQAKNRSIFLNHAGPGTEDSL